MRVAKKKRKNKREPPIISHLAATTWYAPNKQQRAPDPTHTMTDALQQEGDQCAGAMRNA
jgi:hypothetical protein